MNADEGAAVLHPGAEGGALFLGERVAARVVPDHELELAELLGVHHRASLGLEERPATSLRNRRQRRVRGLDCWTVAETVGLREDQNSSGFQSGRKSRRSLIKHRLR